MSDKWPKSISPSRQLVGLKKRYLVTIESTCHVTFSGDVDGNCDRIKRKTKVQLN